MSEEHDFLPDEERPETEESTNIDKVNKFELMCYAQIVYGYFSREVVDLVAQKGMFKIQDVDQEVVDAISIRLSGFEQYGTWLLINPNDMNDMFIASVMPNDEMVQDAVYVRQLEEYQALIIQAMVGVVGATKFTEFFNTWSNK